MAPSPTVLHRRARLLRDGIGAGLVAALLGTSLLAVPVAADPIGSIQAEAAALARKIDDQSQQEEILAQQYDGAVYHAAQIDAQLAAAGQKLAAAQAQADQTHGALAREAVAAYLHDGYVSTPTESPFSGHDDLAVEQGYFTLAANNQSAVLEQARVAQVALRVQQATLQAAQQQAAAAVAAVAEQRTAVEQADAATRADLAQVQGQLVLLVAQQQAQIAAQQQAEELAVLAGQQAHQQQPTTTATTATGNTSTTKPTTSAAPTTRPTTATFATTATTGRAPAVAVVPPPASGRTTATVATTLPRPTTPAPAPAVAPTAPATTRPAPQTEPIKIGPPPAPSPPPAPQAPPVSSRARAAVAFAISQLGKPYAWGAAGPGSYDCSGLTMMAWLAAGVSLPHYTVAQYADTAHVPISSLQPGDLVFFGTDLHHVGLYVGGGMMIDAPHTGAVVRYDSIYEPDLQPYGGRP